MIKTLCPDCVWLLLGLLQASVALGASQIDTFQFADDVEKRRYRALIEKFRCPKCLNTNLAGSDAPIAQDLRKTVHRLIAVEGMSDQKSETTCKPAMGTSCCTTRLSMRALGTSGWCLSDLVCWRFCSLPIAKIGAC